MHFGHIEQFDSIVRYSLYNETHFLNVNIGKYWEIQQNVYNVPIKVRNTARIRNRYNQVPHLSQDTKRESYKITVNITGQPFASWLDIFQHHQSLGIYMTIAH